MSYPTKLQLALSYGPKSYLAAENKWYNSKIMNMALAAFGCLAICLFSVVVLPLKFAAIPIVGYIGLGFTGSLIALFYYAMQKHKFETERLTKVEYEAVIARENSKNTIASNIETVRKGLREDRSYSLVSLSEILGENAQLSRRQPPLFNWKVTQVFVGILVTIGACAMVVIFSLHAHHIIPKRHMMAAIGSGVIAPCATALIVIIVAACHNRKLDRKHVEDLLTLEEACLKPR